MSRARRRDKSSLAQETGDSRIASTFNTGKTQLEQKSRLADILGDIHSNTRASKDFQIGQVDSTKHRSIIRDKLTLKSTGGRLPMITKPENSRYEHETIDEVTSVSDVESKKRYKNKVRNNSFEPKGLT